MQIVRQYHAGRWTLLFAAVAILGCGDSGFDAMSSSSTMTSEASSSVENMGSVDGLDAGLDGNLATGKAADTSAIANRKIIYNTSVGLVVKNYHDFEQQIAGLVSQHGGFIASSRTDRRYNDRQSGTWVVRIPTTQYSDFLAGVTGLGFAESREENAQDVTEEYVDIEARIKNKRTLEGRVVKMLEERPGKLADVLEIERELSRIREELERMEGRLRYLKDRTSLATVTINSREESEYVPPAAPTLGSRIENSWGNSLSNLQGLGENLLIAIVAFVPWLVIVWVPLYVVYRLAKRIWRRRRSSAGRIETP